MLDSLRMSASSVLHEKGVEMNTDRRYAFYINVSSGGGMLLISFLILFSGTSIARVELDDVVFP